MIKQIKFIYISLTVKRHYSQYRHFSQTNIYKSHPKRTNLYNRANKKVRKWMKIYVSRGLLKTK